VSVKTSGLICSIYTPGRANCSNDGISSRCEEVTLVDIGVDLFSPRPDRPAVRLIKRSFSGKVYLHAEPVDQPTGLVGPMFGGTFIFSSDSRFPSDYPIALHDRWDTQETYNALTR
jgi:hypothetical protein